MSSLPAEIAAGAALFAGTNADDVVVLALLSAASRAGGRPRRWAIWAGQYAGFGILAGVSLAAGRALALVPGRWLWLLALVPLTLGAVNLVALIRARHRGEDAPPPVAGGAVGVAALVIANGADDLAAYPPFFAAAGTAQTVVTLAVFAVCVAAWCLAGTVLTSHRRVTAAVSRHGDWLLPVTFLLVALYILHATAAPLR